jgi:large-conductance mechanosensitive channel
MDIVNPISFKEQFSSFIVDNGVVGTAAGVSIAIATKELITSFVGDILIPTIYIILIHINKNFVSFLPTKTKIEGLQFIHNFTTWFFVIVITYLFVRLFFNNFLGIRKEVKEKSKNM